MSFVKVRPLQVVRFENGFLVYETGNSLDPFNIIKSDSGLKICKYQGNVIAQSTELSIDGIPYIELPQEIKTSLYSINGIFLKTKAYWKHISKETEKWVVEPIIKRVDGKYFVEIEQIDFKEKESGTSFLVNSPLIPRPIN